MRRSNPVLATLEALPLEIQLAIFSPLSLVDLYWLASASCTLLTVIAQHALPNYAREKLFYSPDTLVPRLQDSSRSNVIAGAIAAFRAADRAQRVDAAWTALILGQPQSVKAGSRPSRFSPRRTELSPRFTARSCMPVVDPSSPMMADGLVRMTRLLIGAASDLIIQDITSRDDPRVSQVGVTSNHQEGAIGPMGPRSDITGVLELDEDRIVLSRIGGEVAIIDLEDAPRSNAYSPRSQAPPVRKAPRHTHASSPGLPARSTFDAASHITRARIRTQYLPPSRYDTQTVYHVQSVALSPDKRILASCAHLSRRGGFGTSRWRHRSLDQPDDTSRLSESASSRRGTVALYDVTSTNDIRSVRPYAELQLPDSDARPWTAEFLISAEHVSGASQRQPGSIVLAVGHTGAQSLTLYSVPPPPPRQPHVAEEKTVPSLILPFVSLTRDSALPSAVYALCTPAPGTAGPLSHDGLLISGWYDGSVRIYDIRLPSTLSPNATSPSLPTLAPIITLAAPSAEAVYSLASCGPYIVAGIRRHGLVHLWDLRYPARGASIFAGGSGGDRGDQGPVYGLTMDRERIWGVGEKGAWQIDFAADSHRHDPSFKNNGAVPQAQHVPGAKAKTLNPRRGRGRPTPWDDASSIDAEERRVKAGTGDTFAYFTHDQPTRLMHC